MPPTRRSVLGSIGVSGAAFGLGSMSDVVAAVRSGRISVSDVEGTKRDQIINRVSESDEVDRLSQKVNSELDLTAEYSAASVTKTVAPDLTEFSVVLPFTHPHSAADQETYLLWSTSDDVEPKVYDYIPGKQTTVYSVDRDVLGKLSVSTGVHEWEQADPSQVSGDGCVCECEAYVCDSYDLSCVLKVVGSIVGSGAKCYQCAADPTKITCVICLGAAIGGAGISIGCDVGENCGSKTMCIENENECVYRTCN